jgi:aldose 1-epimerase
VELTVRSGELEANFLPDLGLVGTSLRHRGDEVLALPGGLQGYREGRVTGLPLLAPWANRLGSWRYSAAGVDVDLAGLDLHVDEHGLPIHGTLTARPGWEVVGAAEGSATAHFDLGGQPDLLVSFPFPHTLTVDLAAAGSSLAVAVTLVATGDVAVPVSFGWHPYLRIPGAAREEVRLRLPARRHLALDRRGLPTGAGRAEPAEEELIGARTFDDLYELGDDRRLGLAGGGRRLTVALDDGYPYAQVYVPPGEDHACLEPMTAPTNALVSGAAPLVEPGGSFTARFSITVEPA